MRAALSIGVALAGLSVALAQDVPITKSGGDFDSAISFAAPKLMVRTPGAVGHETIGVTVQAAKVKATGATNWYLVLGGEYQSSGWRRYGGISLPGGVQLQGERLRATVLMCGRYGLCNFYEIVTVTLPGHILKAAVTEGMHLRWNAEALGSFEMRIPPSHFSAVALALDAGPSTPPVSAPEAAAKGTPVARQTPAQKTFRPAACDWPGVTQGAGAC